MAPSRRTTKSLASDWDTFFLGRFSLSEPAQHHPHENKTEMKERLFTFELEPNGSVLITGAVLLTADGRRGNEADGGHLTAGR